MVLARASDRPPVLLLAAGYGTRLRPLTDRVPKPLVEVAGKCLLQRHLELLAAQGFTNIFINLHHLGQQIVDYVGDGQSWGLSITYSWEQELLDTGGALKPLASHLTGDELVLVNSDSLFLDAPDINALLTTHREGKEPLATLVLREDTDAARYGALRLTADGRIVRFLDVPAPKLGIETAETKMPVREVMYCGIMVVSKRVLSFIPQRAVSSITRDVLVPAFAQGEELKGTLYRGRWFDVGTPERLEAASREAQQA